jgi:uncharacterized protein (TIGR03067 family)
MSLTSIRARCPNDGNPKSECRNPKQIQKKKAEKIKPNRRRFRIVFFGFWICFGFASTLAKEDQQMIEGAWLPIEADLGGQRFSDETLKTMKLTLNGGKYSVTVGGLTDKGTFRLDPTQKPPALDITGTEGPNQGKTFLAIYEQTDDTLRVCYDLEGKKRPTEFRAQKGTQQFLVVYRRQKP